MPLAIQYGMTPEEFWHGDIRLFKSYQKAYYRNVSFTAWYNGNYIFDAISRVMYNNFGRKKKSDKTEVYQQWKDPFEKLPKQKMSNEELEIEFRYSQYEQNAWLFGKK